MLTLRTLSRMGLMLPLVILVACDPNQPASKTENHTEKISLQGAGASFPAPLYQKWFIEYNSKHPNVEINYLAKGSGAGKSAFIEETVQFAASDAAMTEEEIAKVGRGVLLLPMTAGTVVLAYNLEGVSDLKLSRDAYVGILSGKITQWDDPTIAKANPNVTLPSQKINVVHRSDSSGTTFVLTQHLSAISTEWKAGPGTGTSVNWPTGIGAKGNDGVAAAIKQTPGSIGYVEYGFAKNKLSMAILENRSGAFVPATIESGQAAIANVKFPPNLVVWFPDPEAKDAYPIVTYTWLLVYRKYDDPAQLKALKDVLRYALTEGQKLSADSGYIPLPETVVPELIRAVDSLGS